MRILIDSLIGLMVVAVAVGVVVLNHDRQQESRDIAAVQDALQRLDEQARYHTAVQSAMADQEVLLVHLHKQWFGQDVPTNNLLNGDHPWIDLAPPGDLGVHPPDPVVTGPGQAGFWYNPTTRVFRARVTPRASEALTLALYNEVNGTGLDAFEQIPDPSRRPIAHDPGKTPARQYASLANQTWSEPEPKPEEITEAVFAPLLDEDQNILGNPAGQSGSKAADDASADSASDAGDQPIQEQAADPEPFEPARPTLDK